MEKFLQSMSISKGRERAEQLLSEIAALLTEREREAQRLQALDRRIAELAGIIPEDQTRKTSRKVISPEDFVRGCGL